MEVHSNDVTFEMYLKNMTTIQLIDELTQVTLANMERVKSHFIHLSTSQKEWKSEPNEWNINEIFAHVNEYNSYYHTTFTDKLKNTRYTDSKEIFISSPLGRSAWKSMKLGNAKNIKRKFKAIRATNPIFSKNLVTGNDIELFLEKQTELLTIIRNAAHVNLRKVKIPISISKIIRLRLGDALLFLVYHNERHIQQALNRLQHLNFPKA
jgi:hypothetical protein